MKKEISNSQLVVDGHQRALKGLESQAEALRLSIHQELEAKYADQLASAGFLKRWILVLQKNMEIKRRFAQGKREIQSKAPPDALY
ncbi:MAG TPA: hypothetical protein VIH42_08650 [Thermoguttaceae bacterium]